MPRNVPLTGLPRSGTTLMCHLLNKLPNSVALHEPMRPARLAGRAPGEVLRQIEAFFDTQRRRILEQGSALSKSADGKVPANSLADGTGVRAKVVNGKEIRITNVDRPDFSLFIKHPSFFTAFLPHLAPRMECFATVRNPLSVLLSWRNAGMAVTRGRIPAGEAFDPDLARALDARAEVLDRQLFLLDYFFRRFAEYLPGRVVRYEDVVATGGRALATINPDAAALAEPLASRNALALGGDPEAGAIARRLLDSDNACWRFYDREDVGALIAAPAQP